MTNQITLLLPANTPLPVIGGICVRTKTGWTRVGSKRWYKKRNGQIEATYDLDTLRFCVAWADFHTQPTL